MIVRVDPVTGLVRYELVAVGLSGPRSFGWESSNGTQVRFRLSAESRLRTITFNSALTRFAGAQVATEMFRPEGVDAPSHSLGPGVAAVTDYTNWYFNASFFVMHVDKKQNVARLVIDGRGSAGNVQFVEQAAIQQDGDSVMFEWGAEGLIAIRFRSAFDLLGPSVMSNSVESTDATWPGLPSEGRN